MRCPLYLRFSLAYVLGLAFTGHALASPSEPAAPLSFVGGSSATLAPTKNGDLQATLAVRLSARGAVVQPVLTSVSLKGNLVGPLIGKIKPVLTLLTGDKTAGLLTLTIERGDVASAFPGVYMLELSAPGNQADT